MTIATAIQAALRKLARSEITTPALDVEVILAYVVDGPRSWLHAHIDETLSKEQIENFEQFVKRRLNHEPVAYIIGKKEFYGRDFIVTPDVLIPRPETEDLIDLALSIGKNTEPEGELLRLLDVGTGSGCVGITLKLERPEWKVIMSDISPAALKVARKNAHKLHAKPLRYVHSSLLEHWLSHEHPKPFDLIVANLPYVSKSWETSPETAFEPSTALFADEEGTGLIRKLITQSVNILSPNGHLLLEADPEQHQRIIHFAIQHKLHHHETRGYALSFVKQS